MKPAITSPKIMFSSFYPQSVATLRCTSRKYRPRAISSAPFTASTAGAVNTGRAIQQQVSHRHPTAEGEVVHAHDAARIWLVTMSCTRELTMAKTPIMAAPEKNSMAQLNPTERKGQNPKWWRPGRPSWREQCGLCADVAQPGHGQRAQHRTHADMDRKSANVPESLCRMSVANTGGGSSSAASGPSCRTPAR